MDSMAKGTISFVHIQSHGFSSTSNVVEVFQKIRKQSMSAIGIGDRQNISSAMVELLVRNSFETWRHELSSLCRMINGHILI